MDCKAKLATECLMSATLFIKLPTIFINDGFYLCCRYSINTHDGF